MIKARVVAVLVGMLMAIGLMATPVSAQEAPEQPNFYKLRTGEEGPTSVRLPVFHSPGFDTEGTYQVASNTPGQSNSVQRTCEWSSTGEPAAVAGVFNCDITGLEAGNHFFRVTVVNVASGQRSISSFYWHTAGPATGIVDPTLPGGVGSNTPVGTWGSGSFTTTEIGTQEVDFEWPAYTANDAQFPTVGYLLFGSDDSAVETEATSINLGAVGIEEIDWVVLPITEKGIIRDFDQETTTDLPDRYAYAWAPTLEDVVDSVDYDNALDAPILRLYRAYFNREPDLEGAKYWLGIRRQDFDTLAIAEFMSGSQEFNNAYAGTTDREYLSRVYQNVLGRDFDQGGFDYWLDTLQGTNASGNNPDSAQISRPEVVFYITQGEEFIAEYPFQGSPPPL